MPVKENLLAIKNSIPANVTLVAVSKTIRDELILEAHEAGQRDFGENYVQEMVDKRERLPEDINWHFIGHLQTNKVKFIAPFVHLVHGVDSLKLLREINKQAAKYNRTISCLLQIHLAMEETKFGLSFKECEDLLKSNELDQLPNIKILGFMGMASNTSDFDKIRQEFSSLKDFRDRHLANHPSLLALSIGMSSDYKIAVEEGSTMLRIGSLIFGERNYSNK